ncbi:MAG: reverse transcriptase domain-containing protein [Oscillospiraceae bacterium]
MSIFHDMLQVEERKRFVQRLLNRYGDHDLETKQSIEYVLSPELDSDVNRILSDDYWISIPQRKEVKKWNTTKRRIVFTLPDREKYFLKLMSFCLSKYDNRFCDSLYSFRSTQNVNDAIVSIQKEINRNTQFVFITDISSFGPSVNVDILIEKLRRFDLKDSVLFAFFERLLSRGEYYWQNELTHGSTGAFPGISVSSFFLNVYLEDLDREMRDRGVTFYRYADDMMLATNSEEDRDRLGRFITDKLESFDLTVNYEKTERLAPGEDWTFLGFEFSKDGGIDISKRTIAKIKGRFRRYARRLRKKIEEKRMTSEEAMCIFISRVNRALFWDGRRQTSFALRCFPLITKLDRLKDLDFFVQNYIRYLPTGRFTKKNYAVRYDQLKDMGYKNLVGEYYRYREGGVIYGYEGNSPFGETQKH